jgi:hypothetical protein
MNVAGTASRPPTVGVGLALPLALPWLDDYWKSEVRKNGLWGLKAEI